MSLRLVLPTGATVDWRPINLTIDCKSILRTSPAEALAKAGPALAEVLTLLGVSVGLFSLFLGLSLI